MPPHPAQFHYSVLRDGACSSTHVQFRYFARRPTELKRAFLESEAADVLQPIVSMKPSNHVSIALAICY
jgi:hypothetical protein